MSTIEEIKARQIFDSRGNPTLEVDVMLESGALGRAAVPSGASTGSREAVELRDGNAKMYMGKGVQKAVKNVNSKIAPEIVGIEVTEQVLIDRLMVEDKRAIFMQDEFFIKNYAMQPAKVWTTLKDAKTDLLRIKSDKVYMNYLVFMYKVKMQVNERWTKLIDEIKIVKNEIDLKKQNRAN